MTLTAAAPSRAARSVVATTATIGSPRYMHLALGQHGLVVVADVDQLQDRVPVVRHVGVREHLHDALDLLGAPRCRRRRASRGGARSGASCRCSSPAGLMSSKYCVRPVTWPIASERWTGLPMTLKPLALMRVDPVGGVEDGADDALVARAAADVAGDRAHDVLAGRVGVLGQQRLGGHDHPRRAEAALGGEAVQEGLLERRERAVGRRHALERLDARAVDRSRPAPGRT